MRSLGEATLVTTEDVLDEFLTYYSGHGPVLRKMPLDGRRRLSRSAGHRAPTNPQSFLDGFALYKARPDKEYSLTDCISMEAMRQEGISEILTHDNHFTQEGFTILL